jgi:MFS family permease
MPKIKINRTLFVVLLVTFVETFAYSSLLPLIPFHAQSLGASPITIGAIFATYSIFQILVSPFLGKLSDIYGRRVILILGQIGTLIGFLLLGFSNSLLLLFISRFIDGVTGGNQTASYAIATDVTNESDRAKAFGYMGASFGLGLLLGPGIGALLYQFGFSFVSFFVAFIMLSSILISYFFLPETRNSTSKNEGFTVIIFKNWGSSIKKVLWQIALATFALITFLFGYTLFTQKQLNFNAQLVGYSLTFMAVIGILVQILLLGKLVNKYGEIATSRVGFLLLSIGLLILSIAYSIPLLSVSLALIISGIVLTTNVLSSYLTKLAPSRRHGEILGLNQSVNSICQILGPLIAGLIIAKFDSWVFAITAALIAIIGLIFSLFPRTLKQ